MWDITKKICDNEAKYPHWGIPRLFILEGIAKVVLDENKDDNLKIHILEEIVKVFKLDKLNLME